MLNKSTLIINEIFYSIQGESSQIGKPCIFVRLTGCNLRCAWCDTTYAFEDGYELSINSIINKIKTYDCNLVEITGGEPLLQENVRLLISELINNKFDVMIETGGQCDISKINTKVKRVVDIKCPSSKMDKLNYWNNINFLTKHDEIKFVINDLNDYQWAKNIIKQYNIENICEVIMSPVFGILDNKKLAEWILQDNLSVRFQIQIHKYIWEPTAKGV